MLTSNPGARDYYHELQDRTDFESVVRELLHDRITEEHGSVLSCDCPRHASESNRSFVVDLNLRQYYCFGCRVGGDVIHFVEFVRHGLITKGAAGNVTNTHREARDWLAQRCGMKKLGEFHKSPEEIAAAETTRMEQSSVFACLTAQAQMWHETLLERPDALAWLQKQYGFTAETVKRSKLGFANNSGHLTKLKELGFTPEAIESTGAYSRSESGVLLPFFRERLIFPYFKDGQVVYASGRKTPWTEDTSFERGKYKKLPVYHPEKHPDVSIHINNSTFFNEDVLRKRPKKLLITEGLPDAVSAIDVDFAVISPATVNVKEPDFDRLVSQVTKDTEVIIAFDNELSAVGERAALDLARKLEDRGIVARVIYLPIPGDQTAARLKIQEMLGVGDYDEILRSPFEQREGLLKAAAKAHVGLDALIGAAKVDVCEWFRQGGTKPEFETLLHKARPAIELAMDEIAQNPPGRERELAVETVVSRIVRQPQASHDRLLKLLKASSGLSSASLREMVKSATRRMRSDEPAKSAAGEILSPYFERDGCLFLREFTSECASNRLLASFTAQIEKEIVEDDGAETKIYFEICGKVAGASKTVRVAAMDYSSMQWPIREFGALAIVHAGFGTQDHVRSAIQLLSPNLSRTTVYTHTGWRKMESFGWVYLSAQWTIWPKGTIENVHAQLPKNLEKFCLAEPSSGDDLMSDFCAIYRFMDLGPDPISFGLLAAVARAPFGNTDFAVFLWGPSHVFKSELASLVQRFWGPGMDARNLPASWSSTANANEMLAFHAKDAVLVIDDYAPRGSSAEIAQFHKNADRIFRAQGNHLGRARLSGSAALRVQREPRGLILATGEDLPPGHSLNARLFPIAVGPEEIDPEQLSVCQADAAAGKYARVLAAYIQWIAAKYETIQISMDAWANELRRKLTSSDQHRRTPNTVSQLQVGFVALLEFARHHRLIEEDQIAEFEARCLAALTSTAKVQTNSLRQEEPAIAFRRLLRAAISSGAAHIASPDGEEPGSEPGTWGWTRINKSTSPGLENCDSETWQSGGIRVGWLSHDNEHLFLEPTAALKAAQQMASESDRLSIGQKTLGRRLSEAKFLLSIGETRDRYPIRKQLQGSIQSVLHLSSSFITGSSTLSTSSTQED